MQRFSNSLWDILVVVYVTGKVLRDVLEHSVHRYCDKIGRGEFLQMSGVRVIYDLTKEAGKRVASVSVLCSFCSTPTYAELDPIQEYGVIITSFLYGGGDGYYMFKVFNLLNEVKSDSFKLVHFQFHRI